MLYLKILKEGLYDIVVFCRCRCQSSGSTSVFGACRSRAPKQLSLSDSDPSKTPQLAPHLQVPLTSPQWPSLSHLQGPCPPTSPLHPLVPCPREVTTLTPAPLPPLPSPRPPPSCRSVARSLTASVMCLCLHRLSLPSSHLQPSLAWMMVWEEAAWVEED